MALLKGRLDELNPLFAQMTEKQGEAFTNLYEQNLKARLEQKDISGYHIVDPEVIQDIQIDMAKNFLYEVPIPFDDYIKIIEEYEKKQVLNKLLLGVGTTGLGITTGVLGGIVMNHVFSQKKSDDNKK